ncbi:MAG: hypothetical protein AAF363_18700 [Bacteroidota bacterium]
MRIERKKKYHELNPIAQLFLLATQLVKVLIAGRGFGKSFINGIQIIEKVFLLPKSRGLFLGATYTQILTNTLLPMKAAWNYFGYTEGVHYVVGKRPPSYFEKAYQEPDKYDNVISWWNGTRVILASMDRPQLNRGGNNDWVVVDEALLIKKEEYDRNLAPSIRGSHTSFKDKPGHLTETFTSSMPFGTTGKWLLELEEKAKDPENDTFYIEGTSWHNRKILGDHVLRKWKRTMSPVIYDIEVMNKRVQYGSLFYPSLSSHHFYTDSYNYDFIDKYGFNITDKKDSRWDKDCNPNEHITISHDWGAFNCIIVEQFIKSTNTSRAINYMYVHHPEIIDDLANKFCEYYRFHKKKVVYQTGDKSGNKKEANSKLSYFAQFASILKKNGWRVVRMKVGDIGHLERHRLNNNILKQGHPVNIEFNANNCKDLRIAMELTPMKPDGRKDKGSEGNPNIKQEQATHPTDALDYLLYWKYHGLTKEPIYRSPVEMR